MNEQITSALEKLHSDLNELAPAIEHVKMAESVTKLVSEIPKKHIALLSEIEKVQKEYKSSFKAIVESETKGLFDEHKIIIKEIKKEQERINELISNVQNYINSIEEYLKNINAIDFPTRLNSIDNDISSISSASNNLQGSVNNLQQTITDMQKASILNMSELKLDIERFSKDCSAAQAKNERMINILLAGIVIISIACFLIGLKLFRM